jgi:hypothetical protein
MSSRECIGASIKVSLIDPSGNVVRVIEGEVPDPFAFSFVDVMRSAIYGPLDNIALYDPFGNELDFDLLTPSPTYPRGYLIPGFCLTNCPNAGSTPPDGPGIWLFNTPPYTYGVNGWFTYLYLMIPSSNFITGLTYSSLNVITLDSTPSSPGDIVYSITYVTQSITNTLSSPVNVSTIVLVGAVYGSRSASPVYIPITFYMLSPPIVLSPGVTMTVTVTLSVPYGIAIGHAPWSGWFAV